jgi:Cd2+/Zn2+-exporting ATPase
VFSQWLYSALVFLVISCPCALVISIPLGYLVELGPLQKWNFIQRKQLFRCSCSIQNVVMDKTGTMTEGVFKVQEVNLKPEFDKDEILKWSMLWKVKVHPVATAIHQYVGEINNSLKLENIEEIAGHGLKLT